MKVKSTIAAVALTASTIGMALMPPPTQKKNNCLSVYSNNDGTLIAGSCDNSRNNKTLGKQILSNGCAEGQISLVGYKYQGQAKFSIDIASCLPPNVVQL